MSNYNLFDRETYLRIAKEGEKKRAKRLHEAEHTAMTEVDARVDGKCGIHTRQKEKRRFVHEHLPYA